MANIDSSSTFVNSGGAAPRRQLSDDPRQQILDAREDAYAGCINARRRINALLDDGSFVEYGLLAGRTSDVDDDVPSDGLVGGVGEIDGNTVIAASFDLAAAAGTHSERNQRKLSKLIYLAMTNRWPVVVFVEGDGARRDDPPPPPPICQGRRVLDLVRV